MRKLFTALCAVLFVFGTVRFAGATLEFYSDRVTFNAVNPGLPVEDFEEGNIQIGGLVGVPAPLDSSSNNGVFSPGNILDGVRFEDNPGPDTVPFGFVLIGSDYLLFPMPSKTLFTNTFTDTLDIFFDGSDVAAVGMDVFSIILPSQVVISIYGEGNLLLGSFVTGLLDGTPTFFGVSSDAGLITRINLASTGGQMEGIDDIAFGTPVPDSSTVLLDIKPESCPNPINTKSKGVLPVAILGTGDFDVTDIDVASISLEGVDPIRSSVEDVVVELTLTGVLLDGTPIEETDCIVVLDRGGGRSK
jgi:hypothetical protein